MKLILLKKHLGDILIFIGVIAVFFLTGTSKTKHPEIIESKTTSLETSSNLGGNETSIPTDKNTIENSKPELPPISAPPTLPNEPSAQGANPYAALMNRSNANNIQDSMQNLKGEAPSTEALIERNTYFKKLSDQLKDLQGNVSTDEEKAKGPEDQNDEISDETEELDDVESLDEPSLEEPAPGPQ